MVITRFETFDEEILHCDWYLFPIEMQQWLVTFMVATQQSPFICGFGNSACTRDTFKKVRNLILHKNFDKIINWKNSINFVKYF